MIYHAIVLCKMVHGSWFTVVISYAAISSPEGSDEGDRLLDKGGEDEGEGKSSQVQENHLVKDKDCSLSP